MSSREWVQETGAAGGGSVREERHARCTEQLTE